jgi:ribosomal protein L7Ae-like RNA K-turn-binding protein
MAAPDGIERALSLLGMARRAQDLIIGQDRVLKAIKEGRGLLVITSGDCARNVLRKTSGVNCETIVAQGLSRDSLGAAVGVTNAQIVALPSGSGFVKKLKELLKSGGTLNG